MDGAQVGPDIGQRVIVVGSSNSGKSTLARQIATLRSTSFIELDALYWEPNWIGADRDVFRQRVRQALEAGSWVIAGNYLVNQQDLSWPLADTVIWLDLPLRTVLRRCVVRTWQRSRSKELIWGTNRERFWDHLMLWDSQKSLFTFTVKYYRANRRRFETQMLDPRWSHISFLHLRTPSEVKQFVAELQQSVVRE